MKTVILRIHCCATPLLMRRVTDPTVGGDLFQLPWAVNSG